MHLSCRQYHCMTYNNNYTSHIDKMHVKKKNVEQQSCPTFFSNGTYRLLYLYRKDTIMARVQLWPTPNRPVPSFRPVVMLLRLAHSTASA